MVIPARIRSFGKASIRSLKEARVAKASDHPSIVITSLSSFTRAIAVTGAQMLLWPGWWDPDSALFTNTGGTWSKIMTNQAGARVTFPVTGTKIFGLVVDSTPYGATNYAGLQWSVRPPICRVRRWTNGVAGAWTYGLRPTTSPAGWVFAHDLDPASVYKFEIEPTHFADPIGATLSVSNRIRIEYMREPSQGYTDAEKSTFLQISGVVTTSGATFPTITDARTPLRVLILGDSNTMTLEPDANSANNIEMGVFGSTSTAPQDIRGHAASWHRTIVEAWAEANNRPLLLSNASIGGLWAARTSAPVVADFRADHPGIACSVHQRFNLRTGYWIANDGTAVGRPYAAGTAWDVIVFAFVTNDQAVASAAVTVYGVELEFGGATFAADVQTTLNEIRATYATAKILAVNNQRSDASVLAGVTTHVAFEAACGASGLNLAATNWGRYADIRAQLSTAELPDGLIHMSAAQHAVVAAALQDDLNALMAA